MEARIHRDIVDRLLEIEQENFYETVERDKEFRKWLEYPSKDIPATVPFFQMGLIVDTHSEEVKEGFWLTDNLWHPPEYITYYHWNEHWINNIITEELKEYLSNKGIQLPNNS